MGIINDVADLFDSTATWYPLDSRDAYGSPTYGSGTEYDARVVRKHRLVRNAAGEQVVSTAQVWLAGAPAVGPEDKVTLADGTAPSIVAVERYPDEDGPAFTKVFF